MTNQQKGSDQDLPSTMRAVTYDRYGTPDVISIGEIDVPELVENQVLVEVHASSVNALEWHLLTGEPYLVRTQMGLTKPKSPRLGADMAGVVARVGPDVTRFQPGDEVFGEGSGAYGEFALIREKALAHKPENVSFEQAAASPVAGLTALQGLRDVGRLQTGQRVLVNGASGGVGTYAIQMARALGADHVTAVCSTRNVEMARSMGADRVVDYTAADFTLLDDEFDVIFDIVGKRPWSEIRRVLAPTGAYVMVGGPKGRWLGPIPHIIRMKLRAMFSDRTFGWFLADPNPKDLEVLGQMLETGRIESIIERTVSLDQVPEALRYQGEGHARGKTVVTVR